MIFIMIFCYQLRELKKKQDICFAYIKYVFKTIFHTSHFATNFFPLIFFFFFSSIKSSVIFWRTTLIFLLRFLTIFLLWCCVIAVVYLTVQLLLQCTSTSFFFFKHLFVVAVSFFSLKVRKITRRVGLKKKTVTYYWQQQINETE